jgi:predicted Zn-dependent protease
LDYTFDCWQGNIINGDFTGTLHSAFKIEKGRLVGRIKHRSCAGNIYAMLGEKFLGASREVEQPWMGFDSYEAPHLLIDGLDVS